MTFFKLVPIHNKNTKHLFVAEDIMPPFVDGETKQRTSALLFGNRIDMIGITQTRELLESGCIDYTDVMSRDFSVKRIYYRIGKNLKYIDIDSKFVVSRTMNPPTLLESIRVPVKEDNTQFYIDIETVVNFESSQICVGAVSHRLELQPLGFTISGARESCQEKTVDHKQLVERYSKKMRDLISEAASKGVVVFTSSLNDARVDHKEAVKENGFTDYSYHRAIYNLTDIPVNKYIGQQPFCVTACAIALTKQPLEEIEECRKNSIPVVYETYVPAKAPQEKHTFSTEFQTTTTNA